MPHPLGHCTPVFGVMPRCIMRRSRVAPFLVTVCAAGLAHAGGSCAPVLNQAPTCTRGHSVSWHQVGFDWADDGWNLIGLEQPQPQRCAHLSL